MPALQNARPGLKIHIFTPTHHPLEALATALTRHTDFMLQFKPGTDVALLNAMIHTIIEEDLVDRQYIAGFTDGFAELAARVKDFPPEKMANLCGIDAETMTSALSDAPQAAFDPSKYELRLN